MQKTIEELDEILNKPNILLSAILESSPHVIIFALDSDYCYIAFNKKHKDTIRLIWGQDIEIGMNMLDVIGRYDDRKRAKENFDRALAGQSFMMEEEYGDELLSRLFWQDYYAPIISNDGEIIGVTCFVLDITERKRLEQTLENERKRLETTLISVGDGVISTDSAGKIVFLNRVAEYLTGWGQDEARGKSIKELYVVVDDITRESKEDIVNMVLENRETYYRDNYALLISKYGIERHIEDNAAPIIQEDGEIIGSVLVFRDVSEKKRKQEEIEYLSYRDQLTGLYNRRFYEEELKRLDSERNLPITIAIADVNGLKLINDSFGHAMGDELLIKAAEVIKKGCRADDIIARLGGDEFVIILPKTDSFQAERLIERINDLVSQEKLETINISISFGYDTKHYEQEEIPEVFKKAEDYMYKNKLFDSPSVRGKTIQAIINALYEKNQREEAHSHRVSILCEKMGHVLKLYEREILELKTVGLFHDIGKIAIDEKILNKPGKLTEQEWEEIKRHPEIGYRILSTVNDMTDIAKYTLYHHERWDGRGYPKGLKGEEIPFESRIISIADAYEAMVSERSYRNALPMDAVIEELQKKAGTQFDPDLIKIFVKKILKKSITTYGF